MSSDDVMSQFKAWADAKTQEVMDQADKATKSTANKCKKYIKTIPVNKVSPKKNYVNNYIVKKTTGADMNCEYVLWNKVYQLSHLLENTHETFGNGVWSHTQKSYGMWESTKNYCSDIFPDELKKYLSKIK